MATDAVIDTEGLREKEEQGVGVPQRVAEGVEDKQSVALPDSDDTGVADKHSVALPDSDAIVADAVGVDPAGAQNGPMLNVARCVPSIDSKGEGDEA